MGKKSLLIDYVRTVLSISIRKNVTFGSHNFQEMSCDAVVTKAPSRFQSIFSDFTQYTNVFGINIIANSAIDELKVYHTACIFKGYLDNDNDGICDDPKLCDKLKEEDATLAIFPCAPTVFDLIRVIYLSGICVDMVLFDEEIIPRSCAYQNVDNCEYRFDATLEEVLHLITDTGVSAVYPEFSTNFQSTLGSYIKELNGDCGFGFSNDYVNPSSEFCDGFYAYDDSTCDESCVVTEGIYWAITSLLGAQEYRAYSISNEWLLVNSSLMESRAPELTQFLRDKDSFPWLPLNLPNTTYSSRRMLNAKFDYDIEQGTQVKSRFTSQKIKDLENYARMVTGFFSFIFIVFLINYKRNR